MIGSGVIGNGAATVNVGAGLVEGTPNQYVASFCTFSVNPRAATVDSSVTCELRSNQLPVLMSPDKIAVLPVP